MEIIVAAFQPQVRAALHTRLSSAGLGAAIEVDRPAALGAALAQLTEPLVLAGVRWPETSPFLERAPEDVPVALLLEEELLDAGHPAFRQHGAAALLPWPTAAAPLVHALGAIGYGLRVVAGPVLQAPAAIAASEPARLVHTALSARERELMELVAAGFGNKAIARSLGVSVNTVKYHLASIFAKLDARTRAEAVSAAARRGELTL